MYEVFSVGPNGGHDRTQRETMFDAMRFAWLHASEDDASIISIINLETGEDCWNYISFAHDMGWLDGPSNY